MGYQIYDKICEIFFIYGETREDRGYLSWYFTLFETILEQTLYTFVIWIYSLLEITLLQLNTHESKRSISLEHILVHKITLAEHNLTERLRLVSSSSVRPFQEGVLLEINQY